MPMIKEPGRKRLAVSFSSGETSALMARRLLASYRDLGYEEIRVVMANTSEENEESLVFANLCDQKYGLDLVLLEAVQHPGERKAATHREVTFETASRNGEVFEAAIQKYGIPNRAFKHCTRVLKQTPIQSYLSSLGWATDSYDLAIGIRADEIDRMSDSGAQRKLYPFISIWPTTKPMVNSDWTGQPFRVEIKGYQQNCRWCWKKSLRKHYTMILENPSNYAFPARMEDCYSCVGPEFAKGTEPGYVRTFFQGNRSTRRLIAEAQALGPEFVPAEDDRMIFDTELDAPGGCGDSESCEVFSDDTDSEVILEE